MLTVPWKTTNFVGALTLRDFVAPFVLDGPINRDAFETYVAKVPVPELRHGDLVIMDNLSSHKGQRVREMIEAAGAELRYLPPYSPDFNPIVNAFAKCRWALNSPKKWAPKIPWLAPLPEAAGRAPQLQAFHLSSMMPAAGTAGGGGGPAWRTVDDPGSSPPGLVRDGDRASHWT